MRKKPCEEKVLVVVQPYFWYCRSIEEERTDARYAISVSIVEIYNEMVHDLLAEEGKADPDLQKGPAGFTIPDLTQSGGPHWRLYTCMLQSHSGLQRCAGRYAHHEVFAVALYGGSKLPMLQAYPW